jgi:transcriptional regulator with XRE-family HTH domain
MLGSDLKNWRKNNNFTQEQLSLAVDVKRQTISVWENSDCRLPTILGLALLALEHLPRECAAVEGCTTLSGHKIGVAEARGVRKRADEPGSRVSRTNHTGVSNKTSEVEHDIV